MCCFWWLVEAFLCHSPSSVTMPRAPKPPKEKVLVLARYEDIGNYAVRRIGEIGMEADKAMTNEEADELLANPKTHYIAAVLGNVFVNRADHKHELAAMKRKLESLGIPYGECPTFGDAPRALESIGIVDSKWEKIQKDVDPVAIAG